MRKRAQLSAGLLAPVVLAPWVRHSTVLQRWESGALGAVVARRRDSWRRPAELVTELGAPLPVIVTVGTAALWARHGGAQGQTLLQPVVTAATGIAARRVLAEVVRRGRPPSSWWWSQPSGYSYPSRHVTWAIFGFGAAADLVTVGGGPRNRMVTIVSTVAPMGVAATRIALAVHWPTDVIGAWVFASGWRRLLSCG